VYRGRELRVRTQELDTELEYPARVGTYDLVFVQEVAGCRWGGRTGVDEQDTVPVFGWGGGGGEEVDPLGTVVRVGEGGTARVSISSGGGERGGGTKRD
jgi:hypothetical protein